MDENIIQTILDRIHAIHEEIKVVDANITLKPQRYFHGYKDIARLPMLIPLLPSGEHDNTTFGSDARHSVFSVPILLLADNFLAGSGTADAQKIAEKCTDHLLNEYWNRPRLETEAAGALACVMEDARLTRNSELESANNEIATIRFTLIVATERDMERL
jgi:hypothetical protein